MTVRSHSAVSFTLALAACALVMTLVGACGRSSLDDYAAYDGGPTNDSGIDAVSDAPIDSKADADGGSKCGAATCPTGCCDSNGTCQLGVNTMACGTLGEKCLDCPNIGFPVCDPTLHACANPKVQCTARNCKGCCEGTECLAGGDPNECGQAGQTCQHCATEGFSCSGHQCSTSQCGPSNCSGCCFGDQCLIGVDQTACGGNGQQCQNCAAQGEACVGTGQGGACAAPTCNPSNCNGCCNGNQCVLGTDPNACGQFGQQCHNCNNFGETCAAQPGGGVCQLSACNAQNCGGCCLGDQCVMGNDPNACGQFGQQCQSCTQFGEVCAQGPGGSSCQPIGACGPQNCPGCCNGNQCLMGVGDSTQCGQFGQQCQNCLAFNEQCVPSMNAPGGVCAGQGLCGPQNCAGCCLGNTCLAGSAPFECGSGGQQCQDCSQPGDQCAPTPQGGGVCIAQNLCNSQNCAGCCLGNTCMPGNSQTACGEFGNQCTSCAANGQVCEQTDAGGGGFCGGTASCNAQNCAGCCLGNVCAVGTQASVCGNGGQQCQDCAQQNATCTAQQCVPIKPLCPPGCTGCCDAMGVCEGGFINSACGSGGSACVACQSTQSCDPNIGQCVTMAACPQPYPFCNPAITTPPAQQQPGACLPSDLANAAAECSGGATTATCQSFFNFLFANGRGGCASCLQPFDIDFSRFNGIFECVSPYLPPSCAHVTGCINDCETQSCAACSASAQAQCESNVQNGQCATYVQQASCVFPAITGPGAFCNPNNYGGNFGQWLQGVGGHYCQ